MKLTLSWLKEHLETAATLDQVAETLTRIGLEVEAVDDRAKALAPYRIASVLSAEQHPNADRLRVCTVDLGDGAPPTQVVCGAPNARAGMKSVFAPPGTYIPGKDITLGVGVIRGVESAGMLCSEAELGLSEDHDGIIDLPQEAPTGQAFAAYAGLDDAVIEIGLTPNRSDCASIRGIARDLAAVGLGALKHVPEPTLEGAFDLTVTVVRDLPGEEHLCPAFGLRLVRGVRNGPSPAWMQRRLKAIGLRPINALVDITNYMTFDRGRPLHVFDADKVRGNLVVRKARAGESLLALDGRTYALDESVVVIADDDGPESIGGIMGGEHTGCDEGTTNVLIESALWDPRDIARTGRRLGIVTDARYRFERGVDPNDTLPGLDIATRLVMDLCGGEPSTRMLAGAIPDTSRIITFPWSETKRLSGLDVPQAEAKVILQELGFHLSGSGMGDSVKVLPPSWRPDIEGKADLVEEIVRIAGIDRIESRPLARDRGIAKPVLTLVQKRTRSAKRTLAARGMLEAVTWSFIAKEQALLFGGGDPALEVANPIASDLSDMRPSLLPGLIRAAQRNADRGYPDVALFEVGQCFRDDTPAGQTVRAAAVRRGTARLEGAGRHWDGGARTVDVFDAKADALALLAALGMPVGSLQIVAGGPAWMHPGRSGRIQLGPKAVFGHFGELHPSVLKALDAKGPIVAFEIDLETLPAPKLKPTKARPPLALSGFQPLTRDFAFVVDAGVEAAAIVRAAQGADKALVTDVAVFDVYEGERVEAGKKSVAIAVTLQPREKTLTDTEIEAISRKIVGEVGKKTGAVLRT
ncbi:phenylalanine--tRNA ligase subunit beta [Salinarimonas sp. NSM]|uniref:phenylalanine--tRNA ligase subunit beta n=1 Tax=Salinarimonas sp. NSM TaxID=3458003 RepID=UPI004035C0BB